MERRRQNDPIRVGCSKFESVLTRIMGYKMKQVCQVDRILRATLFELMTPYRLSGVAQKGILLKKLLRQLRPGKVNKRPSPWQLGDDNDDSFS
jgi:hypothetical protein